jgi:hypothetical protein
VRASGSKDQEGDLLVVRRVIPLALSLSLGLAFTLGTARTGRLFAQEVKKETPKTEAKTEAPKTEAPKAETPKKDETKKDEAKKDEAKKEAEKAAEAPPPTVPKDVEEKLEKARRAVAEAIVAAQDAGLVETSIDPPPVMDILVKGYAIDARTLKNPAAKKTYWAVSPEVFCGWFTGYGKLDGVTINPQNDIRIVNPSAGLKAFYDQRAAILNRHIDEVRKAKGPAATPKKDEAKPAEAKKDQAKPAETPKKDEAKK